MYFNAGIFSLNVTYTCKCFIQLDYQWLHGDMVKRLS